MGFISRHEGDRNDVAHGRQRTEQCDIRNRQAFNGRDANALADLYTNDARVGDARGRRAIIAQFESDWAEAGDTCAGAYDGFEIVGDLAAGWGRDTCTSSSGVQRI